MFFHQISIKKKVKRLKLKKNDVVTEQVQKILADTDQKLILMVKG